MLGAAGGGHRRDSDRQGGGRARSPAYRASANALCLSIGADAAINYSSENLREVLKQHTAGKGPDVIYDPVGGDLAERACSIAGGRYPVVGFAQGGIPAAAFNPALLKEPRWWAVLGDFVRREPAASAQAMKALAAWYTEGRVSR